MSALKDYSPRLGPSAYAFAPSGTPAGAASSLQAATISLTAAQIIAMGTTPITIIPAPGTGKAIVIARIIAKITRTATQFTGGGVLQFFYHGLTAELMAASIAAASVTGAAADVIFQLNPVNTSGGSVVTKEVGVDITNATAAFAAGTGTMKLFVEYRIITL